MLPAYITAPVGSLTHMPPLPSEPLNDWEIEVISRWAKNGAPK
jgi:hypothetical protein